MLVLRAVLALCLLPWVAGVALWFADELLVVRAHQPKADCLVMLGGEWFSRPDTIARLYRDGAAGRIILTGYGDENYMREKFEARGVAWALVEREEASQSTWDNAVQTAELMRRTGARSGIIVTSWFHSRRALATFRQVAPDLEWGMEPSFRRWETLREFWKYEAHAVLLEYPKWLWYGLRHGLSPFYHADISGA